MAGRAKLQDLSGMQHGQWATQDPTSASRGDACCTSPSGSRTCRRSPDEGDPHHSGAAG